MPGLSPIAALALLLVPLGLGAGLLRLAGLSARDDRIGFPAWALLCGSLGIAVLELARLLLGRGPWSGVLGPALVVTLLTLRTRRPRPLDARDGRSTDRGRRAPGRRVLTLVLVVALAAAFLEALRGNQWVIVDDDEALFWSLRAKLWFRAGGFGGAYASALAEGELPNSHYPILNPLLQLWCFDLAGRITHEVNRWPLQLLTIALVPATASALRRVAGPLVAGAGTLVLVGGTTFAWTARHAGSDALVALGLVVAWDAWGRWNATRRSAWLGLASLGLTTVLWAKDEGLAIVASLGLAWLLAQGSRARVAALLRPRRTHLWLLAPGAAVLVKVVHARVFGDPGTYDLVEVLRLAAERGPSNLALALRGMLAAAADPGNLAVALVFPLLALLTVRRWIRTPEGVLPLAVAIHLTVVTIVYVHSPAADVPYAVANTIHRLLFQLAPAQLVWIGARIGALRSYAPAPTGGANSGEASSSW